MYLDFCCFLFCFMCLPCVVISKLLASMLCGLSFTLEKSWSFFQLLLLHICLLLFRDTNCTYVRVLDVVPQLFKLFFHFVCVHAHIYAVWVISTELSSPLLVLSSAVLSLLMRHLKHSSSMLLYFLILAFPFDSYSFHPWAVITHHILHFTHLTLNHNNF